MCKLSFSKLVGKETSEQTEQFFSVVNNKKSSYFLNSFFRNLFLTGNIGNLVQENKK
jgi:hypothetical protein